MANEETGSRSVVIPAKLRPPVSRDDAVDRAHLVERLEAAGPTRLRVIVAPTGWGKSELVAQWLAVHRHPVAYVRLDGKDTDPSRCWTHVLAALRDAGDVDVDDLIDVLRVPAVPIVDEVVEPLLPRLEGRDLTLVLEDLSPNLGVEVQESIEALVDSRPASMGVVVVSRHEPALHLPRRRVRDELCEIRLDDLRMDVDATRRIVRAASGVELDADAATLLMTRTEGWAAGLYLAGLSLRAGDDPEEFVERFSGTDRNLSEYLASEVLTGMDAEDRSFLVGTAILDELDAELCDAVLERADSADRLDRLSRTNLFMIPVDARRGTYRYHQLFRQWLDVELRRTGSTAASRAHRRAAAAYASRGDLVRAADHALDSGDAGLAYDAVARVGLELLDTGRHTTLNEYCERLPPAPDPDREFELALRRGWSSIVDGDLDSVDRWCRRASAALDTGMVGGRLRERSGETALLGAYSRLLRGAPADCREILAEAQAAGTSHRAGATADYLDASAAYWLRSERDDALRERLESAHATAVDVGDPYARLLCEAYLALHLLDLQDDAVADEWIDATFATAEDHQLVGFGYLAAGHWARSRRRFGRGDLDGATADAERAIELAERRGDTLVASGARVTLSEIRHALGDRASSRRMLDAVDRDLAALDAPGFLARRIDVVRRQLRLQQRPDVGRAFDAPVEQLTDREMALLRMLPGDLTQRELGNAMHMSFNTVKTYNRQIYRKLGVSSRDEAVAAARAAGLLDV